MKLNDFIENQQLTLEGDEVYEYIDKVIGYSKDLAKRERRKTSSDFEASRMCTGATQKKAVTNGANIKLALLSNQNAPRKDE